MLITLTKANIVNRTWVIFHTLEATKIKLNLHEIRRKSDANAWLVLDAAMVSRLNRANMLASPKFGLLLVALYCIVHFVLMLPCIPLYLFMANDVYPLIYGFIILTISAFVNCVFELILYVKIRRQKLKENFHIIYGITSNIIIGSIAVVIFVVYIALHGIAGFVDYPSIGYNIYFVFTPLDLIIMILLAADYFVYVFLVFLLVLKN